MEIDEIEFYRYLLLKVAHETAHNMPNLDPRVQAHVCNAYNMSTLFLMHLILLHELYGWTIDD